MAINPILPSAPSPTQAAANSGNNGLALDSKNPLTLDTFLKLLTVELTHQDPNQPMTDRDFFAQMSQLGQMQGMQDLQKSSQIQQGAAMLGKTVLAADDTTTPGQVNAVSGIVTGVSNRNGQVWLTVQPSTGTPVDVKIGNVQTIQS